MLRQSLPFRPALLGLALLAACAAGCDAPPIKPVLSDPDPSVKIPAIELAVQQNDRSAIPVLVRFLDSDDPAIRFYANDALKKLTGEDFGFLYYADEPFRQPAVAKWQAWLEHSAQPTTQSAQTTQGAASEP